MAFIDKADYLLDTKDLLRDAINKIGGNLTTTDTFRSYESQLLLDQATLKLDFETDSYGSGASSLQRNDAQSFSDVVTFTRSTTAGRFNELGLYEVVAIDTPRIDHDPATVGSSTDTLTLGYGEVTVNTDYEYEIGSSVVVAYDVSNYMVGKVLASSPTTVTLNVVTVVGSGTYSVWSLIVRLGLLVEESRTNHFAFNADSISLPASDTSATITNVASGFPFEGASTCARVEMSGTRNSYYAYRTNIPSTLGSFNTRSVYIKPEANISTVGFMTATSDPYYIRFDLDGSIAISNGATGSLVAIGDGWYRMSVTPAAVAATSAALLAVLATTIDSNSPSSFLYCAVQSEAGTFPTSYIPTAGSAVTRAIDLPSRTLGSEFNLQQGTIVARFFLPFNPTTSSGRFVIFGVPSTAPGSSFGLYLIGDLASGSIGSLEPGRTSRIGVQQGWNTAAMTWDRNQQTVQLSVNGLIGAVVSETTLSTPTTLVTRTGTPAAPASGFVVADIKTFSNMLSASELQAITA